MAVDDTTTHVLQLRAESSPHAQQWMWNELDLLIELSMRRWHVPGLAIALVEGDSIVRTKGYGVREIGKLDRVDEHTLFAIASCTKAFTASALAMLYDAEKLHWSDPVRKHLPNFQLHDPYAAQEVTIFDLLTHRTGTPRAGDIWYGTGLSREHVLQAIAGKPGVSLRSQFDYNNIMYMAAGQIIPAITEISYDDFVQTRIFQPLGMKRSNTSMHALKDASNVASPHVRSGDTLTVAPWCNADNIAPAAAINSSAADMARWMQLQMQSGQFDGIQLISSAQVQFMQSPQTLVNPRGVWDAFFPDTAFLTYGLGWFVYDYHHHTVVAHVGVLDGMRAAVAMIPKEKLGIVILSNLDWGDNEDTNMLPEVVIHCMLDAYLGLPGRDWNSIFAKVVRSA